MGQISYSFSIHGFYIHTFLSNTFLIKPSLDQWIQIYRGKNYHG